MRQFYKVILLTPLVAFGTGCEAIQDNPYLSQFLPTVAFDGLQVNHVTFEEVDTEFLFAIDNPNPVGIDIEDFTNKKLEIPSSMNLNDKLVNIGYVNPKTSVTIEVVSCVIST